jgi:hypothetical protein
LYSVQRGERHVKRKNVGILLLATILLLYSSVIIVGAQPSEPHAADAMWVEPSSIVFTSTNASVGTTFNVTVWLNMTEDIFAYQVALKYNRTELMCVGAGYTAGATSEYVTGHTTSSPPPVIDSHVLGNGSVLASESLLDNDNVTGPHSGSLIWAEFSILMMPVSGNLTSTFDITSTYPSRTWVEDPNLNNIDFTTFNADYTFIGPQVKPPSEPSVSINANSTSIYIGQSVLFTSTVSGGSPPYTAYQWFLNSIVVPSATSNTWTYTPTATGSGTVYLNVTDSQLATGESNIITVTVSQAPPPITGANISAPQVVNSSLVPSSIFSINITLTGVPSLSACAFNLTYDPQILIWVGTEVLQVQTVIPTTLTTVETGSVWINLNYPSPVEAVTPEPIVTIYFDVDAYGASPLNLTDTSLLDSNGNPITHSESNGLFSNGIIDVAVSDVVPALTIVTQGSIDNINITVANLGNFTETFNVSAMYNTTLIGTTTVNSLPNGSQTSLTIAWNTTGVPAGNYTITGIASILPFEANTTNNVYVDGIVQVITLIHDVAVTNITPLRTWTYEGLTLPINVTTANLGNFTETFNVTLYADNNTLGTFPVSLTPNTSNTTTFGWNTASAQLYHNYTISAFASYVPNEFNTTNNFLVDGIVSVRLVGDVTGSGTVDGRDISMIAQSFGAYGPSFLYPGSPASTKPKWDPDLDVNGDNVIDGKDLVDTARNFGKAYS